MIPSGAMSQPKLPGQGADGLPGWDALLPRLAETPRENGSAALHETAAWLVEVLQEAGLDVVELDDPLLEDLDIPAQDGVFVVNVESGSPAEDAGMVPGDVIVRVIDRNIEDLDDYRKVMGDLEGREKAIAVMIQRDEYTHFVAIKPE